MSSAAVIRVSTAGNNANSGASWALAKRTITAGLAAAVPGDQVWVERGLYNEQFSMKPGVELYGGFNGAELLLAQRSYLSNRVVVSGNGTSSVIAMTGASAGTLIDGLVIQGGKANAGGGIQCTATAGVIRNCVVQNNTAQSTSSAFGGGIYVGAASSVAILNCTVNKNLVQGTTAAATALGGGIFVAGGTVLVANCMVSGNIATTASGGGRGGGIFADTGTPAIVNATVVQNQAGDCGGVGSTSNPLTFYNNIVAFNTNGGVRSYAGFFNNDYNDLFGNTVYNGNGVIAGPNDGVLDPLFVSLATGDYHLSAASPCINSGLNAIAQGSFDIDGEARIVGAVIDRGADERTPVGGGSIVGTVDLQSTTQPLAGHQVLVRVYTAGTTSIVQSNLVNLGAGGTINIPTSLPPGPYDIVARGKTWMTSARRNVWINATGANDLRFVLLNGDIDADDAVTVFDYGVLSDYFDKSSADANWNVVGPNGFRPSDADLDEDGAVTVFDYGIISDNFDLTGEF